MVGFSTTMANRLLDYAFRGVEPVDIPSVTTSLHSADPGATGLYELAGLGYGRQPSTFATASGGVIALATNVPFANLPGGWILYIGAWTSDPGPIFIGAMPNGQLKQFQATAADNVFTVANHGFVDGMPVALLGVLGSAFPGGVSTDIPYYVRNATANTFQLSSGDGGTDPLLDVASNGTGTARRIHRIFPGEMFTVLAGSQFSFVGT